MHIGLLDTPITIQQPAKDTNTFGQPVNTYADVATVWASMRDTSGSENREASQLVSVRTAMFVIRYMPDITMRHRIVADGDTFEITGLNITGRKQYIELTTVQRDKA